MNRNLTSLTNTRFDVLVIGGGITGACVAWDAARRGLRVALVEKSDFGGATSANSQKTAHGGLRYLQDGNLRLVRLMIEERKAFLRIAPHLVHPLPVLMPTYRHRWQRGKWVMAGAVRLNDLISYDRNWSMDPEQVLPKSRVLSASECLRILPGLDDAQLDGGVVWYDAQIYNSERLTLCFLLSAIRAGAHIANYVAATGLVRDGKRVSGVKVRDELTGAAFEMRTSLVVNTAGPWIDEILRWLEPSPAPKYLPSLAMNLVTRQILPDYAVGIHGQSTRPHPEGSTETRSQVLFVAPWRSYSLVGTLHAPFSGHPDHITVSEHEIVDLLAMVNRAYRPAQLTLADVYRVQRGLLPAQPNAPNTADVRLVREGRVYDHRAESGIDGIITVVGVKYTTARAIAQRAVDLLFQKLRQASPACRTHLDRLYGGQFDRFEEILIQFEQGARNQLPPETWRPLLFSYGSEVRRVLDYVSMDRSWGLPVSSDTTVIRAEIIHAVRSEMARKLVDVTLHRTELGSARCPDETAFEECARIMAAELSWERGRIAKEIDEVWSRFESFGRVNDQIAPSLQLAG